MKVRVTVSSFRDKETGTYHSAGDVIEVTKERYEAITKKGDFVTPVKSRAAKAKTDTTDEQNQEEEQAPAEPEPDPPNPAHWPEEDDRAIDGLPESVHYLNNIKE